MLIPFILTLIYSAVGLVIMALVARAAWRRRNPPAPADDSASRAYAESGPGITNRWLRGARVLAVSALAAVFFMHSYWLFWADSSKQYVQAKRLDARNRRLGESGLKGWVLDRTGKLENALIRYRSTGGLIARDYPLGPAGVHLTGYSDFVFGAGGIEHAYRDWLTESASITNALLSPIPVGKDLKVSIDSNLQRDVFNLIDGTGKPAAAVVLLLPNNEVLAMASSPSFNPRAITDEKTWRQMSTQAEATPTRSPLVNRALGTLVTGGPAFYYRPGSTFKTFVAGVAIDCGITGEKFTCKPDGFTPPGSARPIRDYGGESHGTIGLDEAFKVSCNQYFAQLGLKLGRQRLAQYAERLGFADSPGDEPSRSLNLWQVLHGDKGDFEFIFAPPGPRMNLSPSASSYDLALQSIGQGFDDATVMSMALLASVAASSDGALAAPTFEFGATRKVVSTFITPQSAARLRTLMRSVVESGTAAGAFASRRGSVTAGGKTGTADRDVLVYDREGQPLVSYRDKDGDPVYKTERWTDAWFIGYAPAENPQIAYAVLVENGGQGARATVPIAVQIIERAAARGYVNLKH
ncbi:MAG TPA: penicillin-binding transpeptidase domain-containing protein [Blastocatellia bacterium]|nr:penicillin-binding transpeptidase domain-containing protein [Blastocatellia bacterium]